MSLDKAKIYLDRLDNIDISLSDEDMANAAGGVCWTKKCTLYV